MNLDLLKSFFMVIWLLGSVSLGWGSGEVSLRGNLEGFQELEGQITTGDFRITVRKSFTDPLPVAGFVSPYFIVGPLRPAGALALNLGWNLLRPESAVWDQPPGWVLADLPLHWTSAGAFLGGRSSPGGFYVHGSEDLWIWGSYFRGSLFFPLPELTFYWGSEGRSLFPENPQVVPYGETPQTGGTEMETKAGFLWQASGVKIQSWTGFHGSFFRPPGVYSLFHGSFRNHEWNLSFLGQGRSSAEVGRQSALSASLIKIFPAGTLGGTALWERTKKEGQGALEGAAWTLEFKGSFTEEYWTFRFQGTLKAEEILKIQGDLTAEAGPDLLRGFLHLRPARDYFFGLKGKLSSWAWTGGIRGEFEQNSQEAQVQIAFKQDNWKVSTQAVWMIPGVALPSTWEILLSAAF